MVGADPYTWDSDSLRQRLYLEYMPLRMRTVLVDESNPWRQLMPWATPIRSLGPLLRVFWDIPGYRWRKARGKLRKVRRPDPRQFALITGITS